MSARLDQLQPELRPWAEALVRACGDAGLLPQVTSTRRSLSEQKRLYSRYLAGQQPYPVARPGTSAHEYGWAFDMVVTPLSALSDVGALWESWEGVWGGHPRRSGSSYDPVHFEWPNWRGSVSDLDVPGSTPGTAVVNAHNRYRLPTAYQDVVGLLDPGYGAGIAAQEQLVYAPERVTDVLTGKTSYGRAVLSQIPFGNEIADYLGF